MVGELVGYGHSVYQRIPMPIPQLFRVFRRLSVRAHRQRLHVADQVLQLGNGLHGAGRGMELLAEPACNIALTAFQPGIHQYVVIESRPPPHSILGSRYLKQPAGVFVEMGQHGTLRRRQSLVDVLAELLIELERGLVHDDFIRCTCYKRQMYATAWLMLVRGGVCNKACGSLTLFRR